MLTMAPGWQESLLDCFSMQSLWFLLGGFLALLWIVKIVGFVWIALKVGGGVANRLQQPPPVPPSKEANK